MTNLEHFKRRMTADNLCDMITCYNCPVCGTNSCTERLKEWAKKEYKGGRK